MQCITNFVSMDIMANVLLAAGASPAMVSPGEACAGSPCMARPQDQQHVHEPLAAQYHARCGHCCMNCYGVQTTSWRPAGPAQRPTKASPLTLELTLPLTAQAHSLDEVEDFVKISSGLLINMGTLSSDWIASKKLAAKQVRRIQ